MGEEKYSFEVFSRDGKRLMFTNSKECVYEKEILSSMIKAGLKLKENGKSIRKV